MRMVLVVDAQNIIHCPKKNGSDESKVLVVDAQNIIHCPKKNGSDESKICKRNVRHRAPFC